MNSITVQLDSAKFRFRVAAICLHEGHVLLLKSALNPFWFLPGGLVEALETTEAAIHREMAEELTPAVTVGPLQWVVENFFTANEKQFHQICFYYHITFTEPAWYDKTRDHESMEGNHHKLTFRWVSLKDLADYALAPTFLYDALQTAPGPLQHIVHHGS